MRFSTAAGATGLDEPAGDTATAEGVRHLGAHEDQRVWLGSVEELGDGAAVLDDRAL